jgi:hypothetical protein
MADLALDDLSDINAVVDAFRPFREALRVARLAICRSFVLWLVGSNLRYGASPIVAIFVK